LSLDGGAYVGALSADFAQAEDEVFIAEMRKLGLPRKKGLHILELHSGDEVVLGV
jgi:hypothetical protein